MLGVTEKGWQESRRAGEAGSICRENLGIVQAWADDVIPTVMSYHRPCHPAGKSALPKFWRAG